MRHEALILRFLDTHIFDPVLVSARAPADLKAGVRFTRMCIAKLPANSMIRYFWSAIERTERSLNFSERMRNAGFATFQDILQPAREFFRTLAQSPR